MRRVLLVSFFFPPSNVVGAVRASKLARYLPAHGWEPTVLTVDRFGSRPDTLVLESPMPRIVRAPFVDPVGALLARGRQAKRPARVHAPVAPTQPPSPLGELRAAIFERARALPGITTVRAPDRATSWYLPAVVAGLAALRERSFDAILSTAPPPTAHLVAATLAGLTGIPWVADYRDLWSANAALPVGPVRQRLEGLLERGVLARAHTLVTVSQPWAEALTRLHHRPAEVVSNGFDAAEEAVPALPPERGFTITYTGSLYPARHNPVPLLSGVARLRDRHGVTPADLTVRFYGSEHEILPPLVERHGVGAFVQLHGQVPRAEAVARQGSADALLVFGWEPTEPGMLTLKALEYLHARRRILLVGGEPDSLLGQLLAEARVGTFCGTAEQVATTLADWMEQRRRHPQQWSTKVGDAAVIDRYDWRRLAGRYAALLAAAADSAALPGAVSAD